MRSNFWVHRSNSVEALVAVLGEVLGSPLSSPFVSEVVIVPGAGVGSWLSRQLATRFGVQLGVEFASPRKIITRILEGYLASDDVYTPMVVTENLADILADFDDERIEGYLKGDAERRLALARRLTELYHRYLIYRPDWALSGFLVKSTHWQARLWRLLVARLGDEHYASLWSRALQDLKHDDHGGLPERLSVFALTTLPPSYVSILQNLARSRPVHFLMLSPSSGFWQPRTRQLPLFEQGEDVAPLLRFAAAPAAEFSALLEDCLPRHGVERYADPGSGTLLGALQSRILGSSARAGADHGHQPRFFDLTVDTSVQIHSCHSPTREAEVVHDELLDCFERNPNLTPDRVAIVVPSLEEYAAVVTRVFNSRGCLPVTLVERHLGATDPELRALCAWIEVLDGRASSSQVLDLLDHEPIRSWLAIEWRDLETLRHWVARTEIRWGLDGEHRESFGQPADDLGTWSFGLERLWLGFAVADDGYGEPLYGRVVPLDCVRSDDLGLLVALDRLIGALRDDLRYLASSRTLNTWRDFGERLLQRFSKATSQLRVFYERDTLELVSSKPTPSLYPWRAAHALLFDPLLKRRLTSRFFSGAASVGELPSLSAIPFDVIALLGMSEGGFPRPVIHDSLDRTRQARRIADPHPAAEDCQLFLNAVLAARKTLIVSYVGYSVKDNRERSPSPVVSELLATLNELGVGEDLIQEHALHGFNERGYDDDLQLLNRDPLSTPRDGPTAAVLRRPLPRAVPSVLALDDLIKLLKDAPRFFWEHILAARDDLARDAPDEREALEAPTGLRRWQAINEFIAAGDDDRFNVHRLKWAQRSGFLPLGTLGQLAAERLAREADRIVRQGSEYGYLNATESIKIDLDVEGVRVIGRIDGIVDRCHVIATASRIDEGPDVGTWVSHLAGIAAGVIDESVLVGLDRDRRASTLGYRRLDEARELIGDLIEIFVLGSRIPLPLFRYASRQYVKAREAGFDDERARRSAFSCYDQRDRCNVRARLQRLFPQPEIILTGDPVYGESDAEFAALASRVYQPLFDHIVR